MKITWNVEGLCRENASRFEQVARTIDGVQEVDLWKERAEVNVTDAQTRSALEAALNAAGFRLVDPSSSGRPAVVKVHIDGMTCRSCELIVERKLRKVAGVRQVRVDVASGTARVICEDRCCVEVASLQQALAGEKYSVRPLGVAHASAASSDRTQRPSFLRLIGLFALVLLLGSIFSKIGIFGQDTSVAGSMTLAAAIVLGFVAGSSSCLAVSGGLLLSSAAKFNERYRARTRTEQMRPVFLFVAGRIASYGVLGGLIGLLGTAFTFSPLVTGGLITLAAVYMFIMGLEMLHICPNWLKHCMPKIPKTLGHRIVDAEGKEHWGAPFFLGAATFFLPCGFTQALQLYALTTGSFLSSGIILAGFALGTAPALLALGWASSTLKGKAGKLFFQFSGALVVVLGLWNLQNGLTVAGYPLSLPNFRLESSAFAADDETDRANVGQSADENVVVEDGTQIISMTLTRSAPYYAPAGEYTVKAGVPVRVEVTGKGTGCRSSLQIPRLDVGMFLNKERNVMEFTPTKLGDYTFSCGMGMYRGTIHVVSS